MRYAVHLEAGAYATVYVEADSAEEAAEKVFDEELPWLCSQCSGGYLTPGYYLELGDNWQLSEGSPPEVDE